jgi:hypothetical protein
LWERRVIAGGVVVFGILGGAQTQERERERERERESVCVCMKGGLVVSV